MWVWLPATPLTRLLFCCKFKQLKTITFEAFVCIIIIILHLLLISYLIILFFRLDLLFYQFDVKSPMASVVFWHKLKMSVQYGLGSQLVIDIDKVIPYADNTCYTKHTYIIILILCTCS